MQAAADAARIRDLQNQVSSLTAQVSALQPLAPKAATLEAEKASLQGRLERVEEALAVRARGRECLWGCNAAGLLMSWRECVRECGGACC